MRTFTVPEDGAAAVSISVSPEESPDDNVEPDDKRTSPPSMFPPNTAFPACIIISPAAPRASPPIKLIVPDVPELTPLLITTSPESPTACPDDISTKPEEDVPAPTPELTETAPEMIPVPLRMETWPPSLVPSEASPLSKNKAAPTPLPEEPAATLISPAEPSVATPD